MLTDFEEFTKTLNVQIGYYKEWLVLLNWDWVGRKVDFGDFPSKFPDYDIEQMIKNLEYLKIYQYDDENSILELWALFQYLIENKEMWG